MIAVLYNRMRRFRFDWKLTLLTVLLLPLMLSLGFWQLRREAEKLALQETWNARQREIPIALASVDPASDQQYRQVTVTGQFDNAHVFLLDNRIYKGQAGYEVIVPLVTTDNLLVLVNRGWQRQGISRSELPVIAAVEGVVSIDGSIYQSVGDALVLGGELEADGWPQVVQTLDPPRMAELAGYGGTYKVFPHSLRLAEAEPGVLVRYWPVVTTTPEKHRGYAVQWFLMATALMTLYLYYSTRSDTAAAASNAMGNDATNEATRDRR